MAPLPSHTVSDSPLTFFIGWGFTMLLSGIFYLQVYIYTRKFPGDSNYLHLLVGTIWIVEAIDQIFIGYTIWYYLIHFWGDILTPAFARPIWSLVLSQTFGTVLGTIVKGFFLFRVWRLSGGHWGITGSLVLAILGQFVLGMVYTAYGFQAHSLLIGLEEVKMLTIPSLTAGCFADISTAIALSYYLSRLKTGYPVCDTLINRLILYGIGTGFLSGAIGVVTIVLYQLNMYSFGFMASFWIHSKVVAISLMSSLNSRTPSIRLDTEKTPQPEGVLDTPAVAAGIPVFVWDTTLQPSSLTGTLVESENHRSSQVDV